MSRENILIIALHRRRLDIVHSCAVGIGLCPLHSCGKFFSRCAAVGSVHIYFRIKSGISELPFEIIKRRIFSETQVLRKSEKKKYRHSCHKALIYNHNKYNSCEKCSQSRSRPPLLFAGGKHTQRHRAYCNKTFDKRVKRKFSKISQVGGQQKCFT